MNFNSYFANIAMELKRKVFGAYLRMLRIALLVVHFFFIRLLNIQFSNNKRNEE